MSKVHKRTVVFAMNSPSSVGGMWERVARLYDRVAGLLQERGVSSIIAYPELSPDPAFSPNHMEMCAANLRALSSANMPEVKSFIEDHKVGCIVYADMRLRSLGAWRLRRLGVKTVNCCHWGPTESEKPPLWKRIAKAAIGWFDFCHYDLYVAVSKHQYYYLTSWVGVPRRRVTLSVNGIDVKRFSPGSAPAPEEYGLPRTTYYALTVCKARREKRLDFLIDVAAELFKRCPDISLTFVYVGDGVCRAEWEEKARSLGLSDRFCFLGHIRDITPLFRLVTLALLASSREGFGLVTAEAMSCEVPVICSDLPACREIVSHRETGYLLPLDDLDTWVRHISKLLDSEEDRVRMGRLGRKRVEEFFSLNRQAGEFCQIVCEQLALLDHRGY